MISSKKFIGTAITLLFFWVLYCIHLYTLYEPVLTEKGIYLPQAAGAYARRYFYEGENNNPPQGNYLRRPYTVWVDKAKNTDQASYIRSALGFVAGHGIHYCYKFTDEQACESRNSY